MYKRKSAESRMSRKTQSGLLVRQDEIKPNTLPEIPWDFESLKKTKPYEKPCIYQLLQHK